MKTIDAFLGSTAAEAPPENLAPALQALWWLRKGDWHRAHEVVQGHEGHQDCDWVHAHLHRQEGDLNNAGGWYRRAGKPMPDGAVPLEEEWNLIAAEFLGRTSI
jgi:hypothetical protein